jgi:hypothetical protein
MITPQMIMAFVLLLAAKDVQVDITGVGVPK